MNSGMREQWSRLRAEASSNRRLQIGLAAIAAILVLYAFLTLLDLRKSQAAEYAQRVQQLQKMQALAGQNAWIGRAQVTARVRRALEAEIPSVETVGVAQAQLTTWMRDLGQASGGESLQIQPQTPQEIAGSGGIWRIPVTVSGSAQPENVLNMLQQIEKRSVLSVVEQATLVNRENKTYSLTVVSLVRIRARGANAGA